MITVVEPTWEYVSQPPQAAAVYEFIERCGRTCYKSEDRITDGSAERFVRMLVNSKHESVLEHFSVPVRIGCSRACSHQIVRHRIASYSQESQRYCDYGKKGLQVICPPSIGVAPGSYEIYPDGCGWTADHCKTFARGICALWLDTINDAYNTYKALRDADIPPEDARFVLPNACRTEIVCTYNLRMWRHVIAERGMNPKAQWEIRSIFKGIGCDLRARLPLIFGGP